MQAVFNVLNFFLKINKHTISQCSIAILSSCHLDSCVLSNHILNLLDNSHNTHSKPQENVLLIYAAHLIFIVFCENRKWPNVEWHSEIQESKSLTQFHDDLEKTRKDCCLLYVGGFCVSIIWGHLWDPRPMLWMLIIELVEFNLRGSLVPDIMASIMALELARNYE